MSLQIYAYAGLVLQPGPRHEPHADTPDGMLWALVNPDFPGRADDLLSGRLYSYQRRVNVLDMSYGGYNDFREWLAKVAGYPRANHPNKSQLRHDAGAWAKSSGPLWELISFADNEGCIGNAVCKKLAADFAQVQPLADADRATESFFFKRTYNIMRLGVELAAANNGCLEFS